MLMNSSNEGEGMSIEEEELRKWCIQNKKYISNKMAQSMISNGLTLELLQN